MPLLGELHKSVKSKGDVVFWWVGVEINWVNVFCAFESGKMVAKAQVAIVNIVPPGRSSASKHNIYLNIKTLSDRENDFELISEDDIIIGSLMAWREENIGIIEDVFVREPWRKRGIARYLLTQALIYHTNNNLNLVELNVHTTNRSALSLYESVGFKTLSEEIRYCHQF